MELSKVLEGFTVANTLVIKAQVQVIRYAFTASTAMSCESEQVACLYVSLALPCVPCQVSVSCEPCHQNMLLASSLFIQTSHGSVNLELTASSFSISGHNSSTANQQSLPVSNNVLHQHMTCAQRPA